MANAADKVRSSVLEWGDDVLYRPASSAVTTFYPGSMVAVDGSDNAVHCDNTAGIRFDGICANTVRISELTGEAAGDHIIPVKRPWRFEMAIAAAVAGDSGKAVYAKFDNEVSYSQTNSIQVGWVDKVLSATSVLVRPSYAGVNGVVGFDGSTLTFSGATSLNTIVVPDNLADGLNIKEGSNSYLKFVTTNSGEIMEAGKSLRFLDSVGVSLGTGDDVLVSWDGTRLNVTQALVNSEIRWGVDGAGIDQRWYGDTASAYMLWDQSADQVILGGVASMSGLRVATSGVTAITTTRAVTKADSGGVFTCAQSSSYTITVATPAGAGERYLFQLVSPGSFTVTLVATGCTFEGTITIDAATIPATGSTLTFASAAAILGDTIELISTSATKFLVRAIGSGAGGITIA